MPFPACRAERYLREVGWRNNYLAANYSQLCRNTVQSPNACHASWEEPSSSDGFMAGRAERDVYFGLCI